MRNYSETRFNVQFLDEKGEVQNDKNITQKQLDDLNADLKAKNLGEAEITKAQTFGRAEAESAEDMAQLVPNDAARVAHFNRGASIAQAAVVRDFMTDDSQGAVEGVYDTVAEIQTPSEGRRKQTPEEKAAKLLGVSSDDLAAIIAQLKGAGAAQPAHV